MQTSITLAGAALALSAALVPGCATAPPTGQMENSAATIRAAQEVGSSNVPQAALHVQLAREQSERAKALVESGDDDDREKAESLLMRAQADADLGLALAREDAEKTAAQQAVDNVHALQSQK